MIAGIVANARRARMCERAVDGGHLVHMMQSC